MTVVCVKAKETDVYPHRGEPHGCHVDRGESQEGTHHTAYEPALGPGAAHFLMTALPLLGPGTERTTSNQQLHKMGRGRPLSMQNQSLAIPAF